MIALALAFVACLVVMFGCVLWGSYEIWQEGRHLDAMLLGLGWPTILGLTIFATTRN